MTDTQERIPTIVDADELKAMSDYDFRNLCKEDCFKRLDLVAEGDPVWDLLRSREFIQRFLRGLRGLDADLRSQMDVYKEDVERGVREPDEDWYLGVRRVERAVAARITDIKSLVSEMGLGESEYYSVIRWMKFEVRSHMNKIINDEFGPSEDDIEFWTKILGAEDVEDALREAKT